MDKNKELSNIYIECGKIDGKDGFTVSASYRKKNRTISEKAGWVPTSFMEPEKFTATSVDELVKKIKDIASCKK